MCVCVCARMCVCAHTYILHMSWRTKDNFQEWILSFQQVDLESKDGAQVTWLGMSGVHHHACLG